MSVDEPESASADRNHGGAATPPLPPRRPAPRPEPATRSESRSGPVEPKRSAPRRPAAALRAPRRRQRHRIQRIELWSVLKMALLFCTAMAVTMVLASLVVWKIAESFDAVSKIEDFVASLFGTELEINPGIILKQGLVVAVIIDALMVISSVIAAAFYNLFAELFGGVEVFTYEQDLDPRV